MKSNNISTFVKTNRKKLGFTQEQFAMYAGVSLSFLRSLEQGKENLELNSVNKVLKMFNYELGPIPRNK